MIKRGIAAAIILAIFAIAAVSGTAVPYHAPVPRTDMTIHSYNISDSGANGVPLYTVTPVTSPYNYRGNAQMPRIVYQKSFVNTKRSNYTHWKPSVYPDNRWRVSKRFAPRTINPYKPYKPVIEPEEPELTVLEKPEWEIGDWWIVNFTYRAIWVAVANPPWYSENYKYEVVDIAEVDGKECFIVNVMEYPNGQFSDWVLYFEKENLALYQVHEEGFTRKFASDNAAPVIGTGSLVLYDFPAFPLERNVTRAYNFRGTKIQQSVSVDTFTTKDGKTLKCSKVSLQGAAGHNVIQYWQLDVPWWVYGEKKNGQVKAWLEDWEHAESKKKLQ